MWLKFLLNIVSLVPSVVMGVEQIAASAKGSDKKTLALNALGLSSAVASAVAPEHQADINTATQIASNAIDSTVALLNFVGTFKKSAPVSVASFSTTPTGEVNSIGSGSVSGGFPQ